MRAESSIESEHIDKFKIDKKHQIGMLINTLVISIKIIFFHYQFDIYQT